MISVVILAKNEEKNIADCLKSVSRCDEKIVIDDFSEDKTVEIAQKNGAKVYRNKLKNFSDQRNLGLAKSMNEWVLFVDADERVSQSLWYEIDLSINNSLEKVEGYYIRRNDILWGKELKYGENANVKFLRLAKRTAGKWSGEVHERWDIKGRIKTLNHPLIHYPHQSIQEFLHEINNYTDIRSRELYDKKVRAGLVSVVLYPVIKFLQNYIYRRGFMDSIPGLLSAAMMSFHSFLVRGKLWILCEAKQKIS